jgi:peptidoglycan/xylan/chitin deacetylase (PgdA/CDA1 family)
LLGGNSIGSHTYDHARLTNLRTRAIASELLRDEKEWWQFRADPVPYFRPPYGAYDARVLAVAGRLGFRYVVLWDVDPGDWKRPGASVIARRVVSGARAGSIVIMHVLPQTADALGPMITGLARKGLRPVGLDELFAAAR